VSEFTDSGGNLTVKPGDKVDVLLVRKEDQHGRIVLSREKAARVKIWDDIADIYKNNGTIKGKIISRIKGGLSVDIGLQAFLPGSQVDLRPVKDLDTLVGTVQEFRIVKYEKSHGNIVLSRRAALEDERKALKDATLKRLKTEDTL